MNSLTVKERERVLACLTEGMSIRATSRVTGAAKNTIRDLIRRVGPACEQFHDRYVRHLSTVRVQCDEIWSFCYSKQKNVPEQFKGVAGYGSVWTWTAMDADSKLIISWVISDRSQESADTLIRDLRSRTFWRVQISTDGLQEYADAILKTYRYGEVDHGEIIKTYGAGKTPQGVSPLSAAGRYSPARLTSIKKRHAFGMPITKDISTSYMERWNLTLRMQNRRFTRLTNGHSKAIEMHRLSLAITFFHYNFIRKHQSLGGKTQAQAAGITNQAFTLRDITFVGDQFPPEANDGRH